MCFAFFFLIVKNALEAYTLFSCPIDQGPDLCISFATVYQATPNSYSYCLQGTGKHLPS